MKIFTAAALFALLAIVNAQSSESLPPAPTESIGCEPHGDHWHCEGPATDAEGSLTTTDEVLSSAPSAAATATDDIGHDSDHDDHSVDTAAAGPAPTESVGCEIHGDHWHCEGPASATSSTESSTSAATESASSATSSSPVAEVTGDSGASKFGAALGAAFVALVAAL